LASGGCTVGMHIRMSVLSIKVDIVLMMLIDFKISKKLTNSN